MGTASVRAGLFDLSGAMLARAVFPITVHEAPGGVAEHASEEIWQAIGHAVRGALSGAGAKASRVRGLAFDATCSLVLRDAADAPLPLGPGGRDTIVWYDHRAVGEARACTATGHAVLDTLGGAMSPEMQIPKLMWLKSESPGLWARLGSAWDLTDYLGWRATGQGARSICTLAAKWTYLPRAGGFQHDFLRATGLPDLEHRTATGNAPVAPGERIGTLIGQAAEALGLPEGVPVAAGLVDAFAGALGTLGPETDEDRADTAAIIAGTSSCVMTLSAAPWRAAGVWGPFADAILPGLWVNEGGQSATGALLADVLARLPGTSHDELQARIAAGLRREGPDYGGGIDVLPDMNGNRTPFADPELRGVVSGLSLDRSAESVARLYWRSAVGLALGMRQILEHLERAGRSVRRLNVSGGHARSGLLMQLLADATGREVRTAPGVDGVLLGTAMAAATAAGRAGSLDGVARAMRPELRTYRQEAAMARRLSRDYATFRLMQRHREEIGALKSPAEPRPEPLFQR